MRNSYLLISILIAFSLSTRGQTRPSSTVSTSIGGICVNCQVQNANNAWDNDAATYATLAVNLAGVGGTAQATYQFTDPVPHYNTMKFTLRFSGGGLLSGIANTEVFQRIKIELLSATGTVLATYNNGSPAQVDVVSATDNTFELSILNPNPATKRVRITSGDLLSVGLASRDLYIYDIRHLENIVVPAATAEASGKVNGVLCVLCAVQSPDLATGSSDPNADYASFNVPLSINLGSGYLYSRYNWGGTSYSGDDYDVYLALQNDQILSLGTELLFFENSNVSVNVTYSDGTTELFKTGNSLISADVLGTGSGRFYLKIDANDAKSISKVEVRFGGQLLSAGSSLRLYDIALAPQNPFLEPDIEAVYAVNPVKPANEYANGDVLAAATDGNGLIVAAGVTTGTLPAGTTVANNGAVTVTNGAALVPGTYNVQITTADMRGGTTLNDVSIVLGPLDTEAVYTVNAAKPVNDYTLNAILASATDVNGPITSATVTSGTLPAGTTLATDGTIRVTNTGTLAAGTYPLQIKTTDNTGGTTVSSISLVINPTDSEAVYTVNPAKPASDYANAAVLATVTDSNGPIIAAAITSGALPAGTALAADGTITVSSPAALVAGTYPVQIQTTDNKGGTTTSSLSIVLGASDIEAVYTVNPAKPRNDYVNNAVLASATDANGTITAATLTTGLLPLGTTLAADGTIRVSNATLLITGSYPVQITTTDNKGGTTASNITLVINPTDIEAIYTVNAAKPAGDYAVNAALATVTDLNGPITAAVLTSGTLPAGATLNTDGSITVSNPASIAAGTYNVQVTTTDDKGGQTTSSVSIVIGTADIEAIYVVAPAKPALDYAINSVLASATDGNGTIVNAVLTSGTLPTGATLDANGTIKALLPLTIAAGTYPLQITTTDNKGGTTTSNISIVINPVDVEAVYTVPFPKPANDYADNAVLASATDANGPIIAAAVILGTLPAGTSLAANGSITVTNPATLAAGTYVLQIMTTDDKGGQTASAVILIINTTDVEAVYTVNAAKPVNDYTALSVLATVTDANGLITAASVTSGALPPGTALAANGTIAVSNTANLVAGTYNVQVTTTDILGGTTASNLVITLNTGDTEAVYTVNPAKPVNDYAVNAVLATATDANGPIVSAAATLGLLPLGTTLQANGTLSVTTPALLIPGTYPIQITTTDSQGGTTTSTVSVVINPIDLEAIYIVNPPKPVNEYAVNAALATATDLNGPIVSATVTSGSLPAGVSLDTDGTVKVANPAALVPGTYTFQVTTTDNKGGTTATSLSITLNTGDTEAVYTLSPVKPVTDYTIGETVASATDADGTIVSSVITSGILPLGLTLAANGTIAATVPLTLVAGTYNVDVRTTDVKGGTTTTSLAIVLGPADHEALYIVNLPKIITSYVNNDVLATVTDSDGAITAAVVTSGTLPVGTALAANGTITVSNAGALVSGTYVLQVKTTDNKGGTTQHILALIIDPLGFLDIEAVYTIPTPKPVTDLVNGNILAAAVDANGLITASSVTSGSLPPGTILNPDGSISVNNATALTAGVYTVQIETTDVLGGKSSSDLSITINSGDIETVYTVNPAKPVNDYANAAVLASVTDANGPIVLSLITSGLLPPGTAIALNGTITVTNASNLVAGTYPLQITTTDNKAGISVNNITITINPTDIEAVYTVAPAKPVNDYTNATVLASATDANGAIVAAVVTTGTLPAGTALAANGTITVSNAATLAAGTYPLQITTTDDKGGITVSSISILINPTDTEAVYTINPAKPVSDYADAAVLATVTDANGAIVAATVTSGSLPPGTALAANGTITVASAAGLVAGTYTVQVTTTDAKGGTTASDLSIVINAADIEAVYTVAAPKPVTDYVNGNVLASATDANGTITAATVTTGALPAGTALAANGTITVSNKAALVAGTYTFQVTTTDNLGGKTISSLTITINPADIEAVYTLTPAKPVSDYAAGAVVASATDANGPIVAAAVTSGTLPTGTSLDSDGTLKITDPSLLVAGTYALQITTTDTNGGTTVSSLSVKLNPADIEAVYTINAAKPVNDYVNTAVLASATDANGTITSATVTTGTLPPGTALAANGTITVTNATVLAAGTYALQITTTDSNGGTTANNISITINPADAEAVYTVESAKPVNEYAANALLASATDSNGPIVNAVVTTGTLPAGTTLASDGTIRVVNPASLVAGTYALQITTTDNKGGTTASSLSIKISPADIEAVYAIAPAKPVNDYAVNAVIASATDANGAIVSASVSSGALPPGTALAADGTITVTNTAALVAGTYTVQVTTTDANGGTTTSNLSLTINAADAEAVYTVVPPKPITEYTNGFSLATATDPNGNIISAIVAVGPLPAGVTLAANGSLNVFNTTALVAGTYPVQITTTDEKGGTTTSTLSLVLSPADIEAVYTLNAVKPANDYVANAVLASATDGNGAITNAVITTGTLPQGTSLAANGTITVTNPALLQPGTYPLQITTTDEKGGTTASTISIVIGPSDIDAVYTVAPPKNINTYTAGDALATVTDANGPIVSAVVTAGTLPPGTTLAGNGAVSVTNPANLVAGTYTFTVTTTDAGGGTSATSVTIVIPNTNLTVGLAKAAGTAQLQADGSYTIKYTLTVENFGNTTINTIQVTDNLSLTFPAPATVTVLPGSIATGTLVINGAYNGTTITGLLDSQSKLDPGASGSIIFTAQVNLNGTPGVFNNSASVTVWSDDNTLTYTDLSDDGNNPDPNDNGNPADASENDPTPVHVQTFPVIGIAKAAGTPTMLPDGSYDIQYSLVVENLGNENLTNVTVTDNLTQAFPAPATYSLQGNIVASGTLVSSTTFNGGSNLNLLAGGSTLPIGAVQTITYKVNVKINGATVPYYNQATAKGNGSSDSYTDKSTSGSDPDPNGNGNPSDTGEDVPTGIALTPNLVVGIAKTASIIQPQSDGSYRITYSITIKNLGNSNINNLQVTDNLAAAFPEPAEFTLSQRVATGTLTINPAFNGVGDVNLLAAGSKIAVGATHTVMYTVVIKTNGGEDTFYNTATVTAISDDGNTSFIDSSDDGTNPDPNGNGDPTEASENDPTAVQLNAHPVIGAALAAGIPLQQSDGSFLVTYTVTLQNLGQVTLNDVQITDDLAAAFPSPATSSVTQITAPGSLIVNTSFNGTTDRNMLAPGNTLAIGASQQFNITVKVLPNDVNGLFSNTAYATATGAGGSTMTSDITTSGYKTDPNGNGNPSDTGEDQPTTVTFKLLPVIGIAKSASVPTLQNDNSYDVTYTITVENLGNTTLTDITLLDDVSIMFPSNVTFTTKGAPVTTGTLTANAGFNGTSDVKLVDNSSSTLAVGGKETVAFTINVVPGASAGPFHNSAAAFAMNPEGTLTYSDISTNGTNPDPNGNGNPNDANESAFTPVVFAPIPSIGVANLLSAPNANNEDQYAVDFTITLQNLGNEPLDLTSLDNDLQRTFPHPMVIEFAAPPVADGGLALNKGYNGQGDIAILNQGTLAVGETRTITYTLNITPNDNFGTFWNQSIAKAVGRISGTNASDVSNNGLIPDVNGDGKADGVDENTASAVTIISESNISLQKTVAEAVLQDNCTYNAMYTLVISNSGNSTLTNLQVTDDLAAAIAEPAAFSIVSLTASGGLSVNTAFNGISNKELLSSGNSIEPGQTREITFTVNIVPNGAYGPFANTATITATSPEGTVQKQSGTARSNSGEVIHAVPTVLSITPREISIPEGFSPNGDGQHDVLEVSVTCGMTAKLSVYNRWGDKVYFEGNYKNSWDGYSNQGSFMGKALPDGTYFYTAELSNGTKITNFITIKR